MEYLLGWSLLAVMILALWLVVRFAGGEQAESRASCGLGGCASRGGGRRRADTPPSARARSRDEAGSTRGSR